MYGASIMGVGVGAVAFHASSGKLRSWGRKLDYWVRSSSITDTPRILKTEQALQGQDHLVVSSGYRCFETEVIAYTICVNHRKATLAKECQRIIRLRCSDKHMS